MLILITVVLYLSNLMFYIGTNFIFLLDFNSILLGYFYYKSKKLFYIHIIILILIHAIYFSNILFFLGYFAVLLIFLMLLDKISIYNLNMKFLFFIFNYFGVLSYKLLFFIFLLHTALNGVFAAILVNFIISAFFTRRIKFYEHYQLIN